MIPQIETLVWQAEMPLLELAGMFSEETRVKKTALTALSAFSATLATASLAAVVTGTVSLSTAPLSIPLAVLAFFSFKVAGRLKNYDDPLELQAMKEAAKSMTFSELVKEHRGIDPLLSNKVIDSSELRSKFLIHFERKSLAEIMQDTSLSYIRKYNLMTKEHVRKLFLEELSQKSSISDLYNSLESIGMDELRRFEVITEKEYGDFESLLAEQEKVDASHQSLLLRLNTQFLGRRDLILADLEGREKKEKETLQKAHSQEKPTPFCVVRGLQSQLKAVQEEKTRVFQDGSIGLDLQNEYEKQKEEGRQGYEGRKKEIQRKFEQIRSIEV